MPRLDHIGWQRSQPERHVAGRRPPSPEEHEGQRLAHEQEMEAHQANAGGLDWLTTLQRKNQILPAKGLVSLPSFASVNAAAASRPMFKQFARVISRLAKCVWFSKKSEPGRSKLRKKFNA